MVRHGKPNLYKANQGYICVYIYMNIYFYIRFSPFPVINTTRILTFFSRDPGIQISFATTRKGNIPRFTGGVFPRVLGEGIFTPTFRREDWIMSFLGRLITQNCIFQWVESPNRNPPITILPENLGDEGGVPFLRQFGPNFSQV